MRFPHWTLVAIFGCGDKAGDTADTGGGAWGATDEGGDGWADSDTDTDADTDADGDWDSGDDAADEEDTYDPEAEDSFLRLEPSATPDYVFVANPDRDTLSRIAVPALEVVTATVGDQPGSVLSTPDGDIAVVFNEASDDVSIVATEDLDQSIVVDVRDDMNQMIMSPAGRWVALWHDQAAAEADESPEATEGVQSYNEVSFVDLDAAEHHAVVVGFNPRDIQFARDGALAVVVSDAWLALADLSGDEPDVERIQVAEDTVDPPAAEEVLVSPDGAFAFVRQFQETELVVVDLFEGSISRIPVGSNPTDLELSADAAEAVAVARESHELWVFDATDPGVEPRVVDLPGSMYFGQVALSSDGKYGLLWSDATGQSVYGVWDRSDDSVTVRSLVKPVDEIQVSPDGGTALVFHPQENAADADRDSPFYDEWALTIVDLDDFFSNPLLLAAEPDGLAISEDGSTGFYIMDGLPYLEVIHFDTLLVDEVELPSVAARVGVLPGTTRAFASQEHELGRISFYDWESETVQTITGFELNAGIEH